MQGQIVCLPNRLQIDHLAAMTRFIHRKRQNTGLDCVERGNRKRRALDDMGDDILRHLLVRTIMLRERGCRRIGLGQGLFIGAGIMHVEKTAHEIALRHALGADDAETAEIIGNVEIGMESKRSAVFIFDDRRLVIDDIAVTVENLVGSSRSACDGKPPCR